ncbi:MotA/TolQ/ExbB proton channel family protein [Cognatiyoonia sp. IB215182]|uniref:MotA/TolQ/ExbB proton channel family protein n=1 Tax=Cognatiyoonia sp. IB215182 TaxID=3097353 RepID=UPI002A15E024|nr:MotA/TolQ/ExbB proton channel family protein [Cognatiyoonia sp. IB215182]MDX8355250.1 MotA/TolQ/ExbB proton channel family protein [Cognatiyoonia sp. IB215182]
MIARAIDRIVGLLELGGPVVAILIVLSVVALAIAIWKAVVFMIEGIGRSVHNGFVETIIDDLRVTPGNVDTARAEANARLDAAFGEVSRGLRVLDLTAQLAPLLGLFGTVLGMIEAFQSLQDAGSTADPSLLAGGIWVALMTTAVGLCVAIPASVLLAWFDGRLISHRMAANVALEARLGGKAIAQAAADQMAHHAG